MKKTLDILHKLYRFSNTWTGTIIIVLLVIFFVAQAFVIPSGSMKNSMLIGDHLFVKKFAYGVSIPRIPWVEIPILPDFKDNGHLIDGDRPQRGDIAIFRYPDDEKIHYVKRCVAVGGDEVLFTKEQLLIHPKGGDIDKIFGKDTKRVEIDGRFWAVNPYMQNHQGISYSDGGSSFDQMINYLRFDREIAMQPIRGEDFIGFYYKVEEDNFFMVGDNRDHSNDSRFWGGVPYKYIVGKPWFIYFSWDDEYKIRWDRIGYTIETLEKRLQRGKDLE